MTPERAIAPLHLLSLLLPGPMYIIARCIIGFGLPFAIVAGSCLIGELGYPKERPVLTSLFNACYFIGAIVAAGE